ncbi:quinone oxidoreductase-like protein [Dermatophagoides farinae]|uniref:15-oxoprostaglandin 13-reductase n=1 Tax=Dermatophagoides farinae TaxID=6954 RepID=A0A9D4P505_DERFA|nr:probable quinone oxidoreductase [Dermatophagoides farinae]KAH7643699.1 quinone oxidoreductase-like protein [Dermatophagoides farinae]
MYKKLQVFTKTTNFRQATKLVECPLVKPNDEEIRVKNIYAGVNATDINITAARYFTDGKLPFDIGLEALGIVDEIGSNVTTTLKKGQPVLALNGAGFSEYVYSSPKHLIPLPELKPDYLVTYVNGLTASIALDKAGHIKAGDKVLVTAAAGGTGQIVVQWAKHRGAYVIAMTSSEKKAEYLKKLGADFIINYKTDNIDQVLSEKFPDGIDVVWETIGGDVFSTLFKHLAIKGRMVLIGSITTYSGDQGHGFVDVSIPNLHTKLVMRSLSLTGFMLMNYREHFQEYFGQLIPKVHKGEIKVAVDLGEQTSEGKFFGLEQVVRAEEHLHGGKNLGKVVVQIQEP